MPSKKELLARIEKLEARLTYLENMHAIVHEATRKDWTYEHIYRGKMACYNGRRLTKEEIKNLPDHPKNTEPVKTWTERVSDVTFGELARYILDGTPIQREGKISAIGKVTLYPDKTVTEVHTKLGDIITQENKNVK